MQQSIYRILVVITILFVTKSFSQGRYDNYNRLGISAGIHQFDIKTDDLVTTKSTGFQAGLSTRGTVARHVDMVYFLHLNFHEFNVMGRQTLLSENVEIPFNLLAAKIGVLGSYKISEKHFSVEFGPALQLSEKFEVDSEFEDYILQGYDTFTAKEARQTNRVNIMGIIGVSAGFQSFKISLQYEYGISNVLSKLSVNNQQLKGHIEQLSVLATFYL
ncbi:outer membrane protein with beta-barrel domain [Kordia periserrulae]|uniref:Outer membrane protein with beta-barrel domain n=1 Tax=Kordia periserrulae TaxID=701523 RepID=A0A2T6BWN4_9FLAO|nr:outer membrane beta-barrel protein [Kordia periserrulae]PTX60488.1 outer membrane protein with beta-barrel domain [Kordia periserrulae]